MDPDALATSQQPAGINAKQSPSANGERASVPIPDHKLLRRIGRGSYGEVWLAQNSMGTYRAVKIVFRSSFRDQRPFERELSGIRKFEPISRLHEGFVDILHVGINPEQGCFYYVMELGDDEVAGQTIDPESYVPKTLAKEVANKGRLSFQESLQLGLALSLALGELHRHRLVHRDIKPSNIIYVNGVPKLADIGLVAEVNEAPSFVGTEGFIPPEGPGTPQADVYSLGKVLYEASTGKDRLEFPELPAALATWPDLKGLQEVNEVILRACKSNPGARYGTAWEMHADLLVIVNGKSIRRLHALERRFAHLKRLAAFVALGLSVLVIVGYQVYLTQKSALESRQRQVGSTVTAGIGAMGSGDLLGSLPYFAEAIRLEQRSPERASPHRVQFGSVLAQCPKLTGLRVGNLPVMDATFSPDGQHLAIAEFSGKARIFDLPNGTLGPQAFECGGGWGLYGVGFSPDGQFVLTASEDGAARIWSTRTYECTQRLLHPAAIYGARFSPDGLRVVTGCKDGLGRVWDAHSGQLELVLKRHTECVAFAAFSHDGQFIVTASRDNSAQLWSARDGRPIGEPLQHGSWVTYAAFSPDDQKVVTAGLDHKARVWEVPSGRRIPPDLNHTDGVRSAEFSPDGRLIVTACWDGTARLWGADTLEPLRSNPILRHGERVMHAGFSPDAHQLLTACYDGTLRLWELAGGATPPTPKPRTFSADGSRFLTASGAEVQIHDALSGQPVSPKINVTPGCENTTLTRNGRFLFGISTNSAAEGGSMWRLQVWNATTGKALAPPLCFSNGLAGASLSEDGQRLVTVNGKMAQVWNVLTGIPLSAAMAHAETLRTARLSPDGKRLATSTSNKVYVWDAASGRALYGPWAHPQPVEAMTFSPNGLYLVTCCSDEQLTKCSARIWNVESGQPVAELKHKDGVLQATFSLDGRRLVTSSEDFTAILWEAPSGRQLFAPFRHEHQVRAAAFSPDGKWIVTASNDKTARLWSVETGEPLMPPLPHLARVSSAGFLAGGLRIVTGDVTGQTRIWPLRIDQRPVADLLAMAQLLSGGAVLPTASWNQSPAETLESIWRRLRAQYPADFTVSTDEIAGWHAFKAEESESEGQWFAATFHLEQLVVLRPNDPSLRERLAQAKDHLKNGGSAKDF